MNDIQCYYKMNTDFSPESYERLVNEKIEWLKKNTPVESEQKYIIEVMIHSIRSMKKMNGYNPFISGYTPKCNSSVLPDAPKGDTGESSYKLTEGN